jgi:hypothetical protein
MPHAVSLLRAARLATATKPFSTRGGVNPARCEGCRLVPSHCLCALRPTAHTLAGICLLMADVEPLKPTNTGWLVADVVPDTFAFGWSRTHPDPALLALLRDPAWEGYVVFPGEYAAPERVVHTVPSRPPGPNDSAKRPLFILLDGTWSEARKMFNHSPYLNALPVLSLAPAEGSQYRLRRSRCSHHFCTSEVAAQCLGLAGDTAASETLDAYLGVFMHHYLLAKNQVPLGLANDAYRRLTEAMAGRADGRASVRDGTGIG